MVNQDFIPCYRCGRPATDRHHVFGGNHNRHMSEKYGLVVYLCRDCHNLAHRHGVFDRHLRQTFQRKFEAIYGHEKWMAEFGRSYL